MTHWSSDTRPTTSDGELLYEVKDHVAWLTLNRPAARNALSPTLIAALREALQQAGGDREVRCVVITGAGDKAFCAGGDLGAGGLMTDEDGVVGGHAKRGHYGALLTDVLDLDKPSIACVNGTAVGGGFGLLCACDLAVAAEDATFGTPEVRLGLFPMMIMSVVTRVIGRRRALELLLTAERIDARKAESWGLVNRVVPRAELHPATAALAARIASFSPVTVRLGRRAFATMSDMETHKAIDYLNAMLSLNLMTEDAMEGIAAFLEKREPAWRGK